MAVHQGQALMVGSAACTATPRAKIRAPSALLKGGATIVATPTPSAYQRLVLRQNVRLVYAAEIEVRKVVGI